MEVYGSCCSGHHDQMVTGRNRHSYCPSCLAVHCSDHSTFCLAAECCFLGLPGTDGLSLIFCKGKTPLCLEMEVSSEHPLRKFSVGEFSDFIQWICPNVPTSLCLLSNEGQFCVQLEHSSADTVWMIQKAEAMGNWWLAASSQQHARSHIVSYEEVLVKYQITQVLSPPTAQIWCPVTSGFSQN